MVGQGALPGDVVAYVKRRFASTARRRLQHVPRRVPSLGETGSADWASLPNAWRNCAPGIPSRVQRRTVRALRRDRTNLAAVPAFTGRVTTSHPAATEW